MGAFPVPSTPSSQTSHAGRYATSRSCSAGGDAQCVTLMDGREGSAFGCYSADALNGRTGDVGFKNLWDKDGGCSFNGCGEKPRHVHALCVGSASEKAAQYVLFSCSPCEQEGKGDVVGKTLLNEARLDIGGTATTIMDVAGICCPSEVPIIERALSKLPGVANLSVNVTLKQVTVVHDTNLTKPGDLVDALNRASLGARLKRSSGESSADGLSDRCPSPLLVMSGILWAVSLGSFAGHGDDDAWQGYLKYVALGAIAVGLPRIAFKAFGALRNRVLDINCLMSLATVGAIAVGDYVEGGAVVFLFGLSEWLENMATAKARNALKALLELKPEQAILASTGQRIPVEQVQIGDRLKVLSGEKVPVDGTVEEGSSSLDESALTGESRPVSKKKGSSVSAGTVNIGGGYLEIIASATSQTSTVARMVKLIEEANASRSVTEKRVEAFAKIYTPVVLFAAVSCAVVPWFFTEPEIAKEWVYTALVLLVVSCPCALVISTPFTYVCTLTVAASHGILIRGGEHLEALGSVACIGMDKTGTLTEGRFLVRQAVGPFIGSRGNKEWAELLACMAAVERKSSHPVAAALVAHCKAEGADIDREALDVHERSGEGVEATVRGIQVQVGSRRLAQRMGWLAESLRTAASPSQPRPDASSCFPGWPVVFGRISKAPLLDPEAEQQVNSMEQKGYTVCYLGIDGRLAAIFGVADVPRAQASAALAGLKTLGVETVMLTGDRRQTAQVIAEELGVSRVQAELLPEDKVTAVRALNEECKKRSLRGVAMIGDGVNDAAALAASTVGVAMGAAGTQVAVESAHVVLMDSDLNKLVTAIKLGRHAVLKIKQNIAFSVVSKVAMLAIIFAGYASLWGAIAADVGGMLLVVLNSSLVLGQRRKTKPHTAAGP